MRRTRWLGGWGCMFVWFTSFPRQDKLPAEKDAETYVAEMRTAIARSVAMVMKEGLARRSSPARQADLCLPLSLQPVQGCVALCHAPCVYRGRRCTRGRRRGRRRCQPSLCHRHVPPPVAGWAGDCAPQGVGARSRQMRRAPQVRGSALLPLAAELGCFCIAGRICPDCRRVHVITSLINANWSLSKS